MQMGKTTQNEYTHAHTRARLEKNIQPTELNSSKTVVRATHVISLFRVGYAELQTYKKKKLKQMDFILCVLHIHIGHGHLGKWNKWRKPKTNK